MRKFSLLSMMLILAVFVVACAPMPAAEPTKVPAAAAPATAVPAPEPTKAPAATAAPAPAAKDIVDTAVADGRFKTLVAAVQAAGLVDTLKGKGPFTVFAPSDDAFVKLPAGTVDGLLKDPAKLKDILLYHVVAGNVMAADAAKLTSANTVQGQPIAIKVDGNKVMINDALVTIADIKTSNGVIHVIDKVILPPAAKAAEPTKPVTATTPVTPTVTAKDIVDTAVADGRFKTLVAAVQAAGLVDTLKGKGPFTVFAPTDEAFAKLPAGTVEALLKDPAKLKEILLYHVVAGNLMAADAAKLTSADTVLGKPIAIKVKDGKVMINDATVIIPDVKAGNGVIHLIDSVMLPPSK
jgi:transforming growth factor-beta-induced protein